MLKEVLNATLTTRHKGIGLYLEEDEDFLYLKREGQVKPIATWLTSTVTVAMIRDVADAIVEREE